MPHTPHGSWELPLACATERYTSASSVTRPYNEVVHDTEDWPDMYEPTLKALMLGLRQSQAHTHRDAATNTGTHTENNY